MVSITLSGTQDEMVAVVAALTRLAQPGIKIRSRINDVKFDFADVDFGKIFGEIEIGDVTCVEK